MKNNIAFYKILGMALIISALSCTSLDEETTGLLTPENFFATVKDLDAGVVASFRPLLRGNDGFDGLSVRGHTLNAGADDLTSIRGSNKERILDFNDFIFNTENLDVQLTWKSLYTSIAASNLVISSSDNVTENQEQRDKIVGQAYFMRALGYYYLVRWWGGVPLVLEIDIEKASEMERSSVKQVYDQILSDAMAAEKVLPETWDQVGRPTLGATKTLLANVYLSMSGWPLKEDHYAAAAQKAKEVIDMGMYSLEPSFVELWAYENRNGQEQIFNLQTAREEGVQFSSYTLLPFNPYEERGWYDYASEINFFNEFPDDTRKPVTFKSEFEVKRNGITVNGTDIPVGDFINWKDSRDGLPMINKFSSGGTTDRTHVGGALHPIFRYAEVLLIYAEASGPTPEAYEQINMVRRRANGLDINTPNASVDLTPGLPQNDFIKAVLQERAWEFAFEGKRWYDLVRREMVEEANQDDPNVQTPTKDNYLMPIPALERLVNPNIKQNPEGNVIQ